MKLVLIWEKENQKFELGILEKINDEYVFKINEEELKNAIKLGCMGIGNFDLLKSEYRNKELFSFFKNRIPAKDNINIKETLEELELKEYDEMELLKLTGAELITDNYYMKEV